MFTFNLESILKLLFAVVATWFGLTAFAGCANPEESPEQRAARTDAQMQWVDKLVEIAEKHAVSYRIEVNTTGRPSVGESLDFYLDTGLSARGIIFGNGAAGRQPEPGG